MCICVYIYAHVSIYTHSHCAFSCGETYAYSSKTYIVVMLVVLDEHSFE